MARKELMHIIRDPATLFITLLMPVAQMFLLGYAINTNVRNIRTVVFDQARTQESRSLLLEFTNSGDFTIVDQVFTDEDLSEAIVTGQAQVGIKIPENYSRRLQAGETAQVLILVDGSQSSVAAEVVNVGHAIALRESLKLVLQGKALPVEARPRVLFNPDTRSPNFFIPGLMVLVCQSMAVMLASFSIVREKEIGTLEQLFMTPVQPMELILGKLLPYLVMTFLEFCFMALLMRVVFDVPINGSTITLLGLAIPFIVGMLGLGLWVSTVVSTREAAMQVTVGTLLPSIFLTGYVFPFDSMPTFFQYVGRALPTTWMIDAVRGVILRGAGWKELWLHAAVLWGMALGWLVLSVFKFRKQLV